MPLCTEDVRTSVSEGSVIVLLKVLKDKCGSTGLGVVMFGEGLKVLSDGFLINNNSSGKVLHHQRKSNRNHYQAE